MLLTALYWATLARQAELLPLLAAGLVALVSFRRLSLPQRYLALLVWFGMAVEVTGVALQSRHIPNLFLVPIDAAGGVWVLSLLYKHALQWPTYSRWQPWVASAFVLGAALSGWLMTDSAHFQPTLMVSESLMLLLLPVLYFRKLLNELHVGNLAHDAIFWLSAGLLPYALVKLLIGLFSNYLLAHYSRELNLWVWFVHAVLLFVLYSCYLRALWLRPQK